MSTKIGVGHLQAHEKLTARVYFNPSGETGFIDLGNVLDYKVANERQTRNRMSARGGFRVVDDEQVDTVHDKWEFTLDEVDDLAAKLLALATKGSDTVQTVVVAPSGTATLSDVVKGRSYFIGRTALNTFVLKKASTTLVAGTDYTVDTVTGRVTILEGSVTVSDGDDLDATFGAAAQTWQNFTGVQAPLFAGNVRIEEFNQLETQPLRITTFAGVLNVTTYPEQTGEFGKFVVRATPTAAPTIVRRHAAV